MGVVIFYLIRSFQASVLIRMCSTLNMEKIISLNKALEMQVTTELVRASGGMKGNVIKLKNSPQKLKKAFLHIADDLALTPSLLLCNYGKGRGKLFISD